MPAYGEERNLAATVTDFLRVLQLDGVPHCVVVVNDGSPDRTGEVAERLAAEHPGRVLVVHHDVNRGYGAAVATGIKTGLELNGHRWLFLTDSDGQFEAAELPSFLAAARLERADAAGGHQGRGLRLQADRAAVHARARAEGRGSDDLARTHREAAAAGSPHHRAAGRALSPAVR
jgi:glycosyltransferase involved in cell wall biosynthesis